MSSKVAESRQPLKIMLAITLFITSTVISAIYDPSMNPKRARSWTEGPAVLVPWPNPVVTVRLCEEDGSGLIIWRDALAFLLWVSLNPPGTLMNSEARSSCSSVRTTWRSWDASSWSLWDSQGRGGICWMRATHNLYRPQRHLASEASTDEKDCGRSNIQLVKWLIKEDERCNWPKCTVYKTCLAFRLFWEAKVASSGVLCILLCKQRRRDIGNIIQAKGLIHFGYIDKSWQSGERDASSVSLAKTKKSRDL